MAVLKKDQLRIGEEIKHSVAKIEKTVEPELKALKRYWGDLGPGLTTGAADDDPSGIATYSQTGALYGFQLGWLALVTFPLMAAIQEMCARVGIATGEGLAANIRRHFSSSTLIVCAVLVFIANSFNIGADLGVMTRASELLFPSAPGWLLIIFFTAASLLLPIFTSYRRYASVLKWLALTLVAYILVPFLISGFPWREALRGLFVPSLSFSTEQLLLVCAFWGTTISPYLFFWEPAQEVEEEILEGETSIAERRQAATSRRIKKMRLDNFVGMFFSNIVAFFIVIACAGALWRNGIFEIESAEQAALALRPLAGDYAYLLFTLGIVSTGMLAIPILAGSAAYAVAESFGWREGLFRKLKEASAFYGIITLSIIVGLAINLFGFNPIKALIYAAVLNGCVVPIILVVLVRLAGDKKIMGRWANKPLSNWAGWVVIIIMSLAGIATIVPLFWQIWQKLTS